jgi:hypothetical protein
LDRRIHHAGVQQFHRRVAVDEDQIRFQAGAAAALHRGDQLVAGVERHLQDGMRVKA